MLFIGYILLVLEFCSSLGELYAANVKVYLNIASIYHITKTICW